MVLHLHRLYLVNYYLQLIIIIIINYFIKYKLGSNGQLPPPPPPPPLSTNTSLSFQDHLSKKRIVYNPKCLMKTLYWSKVNLANAQQSDKTVWEYTDDLELKFDEFEKLFAQPKIQPKKVKSTKKEDKVKAIETADLLGNYFFTRSSFILN